MKKIILFALVALMALSFIVAQPACEERQCFSPQDEICQPDCGPCDMQFGEYGYCFPGEPSEAIPEFSALGVGALVIAAAAVFVVARNKQ